MSADYSHDPSNESPTSSVSSLHNEDEAPPRFVSVEPPIFSVIEVAHDPPSFALSAALEEATQLHPPVSPRTATRIFNCAWNNDKPLSAEEAEDFLRSNEDLEATVWATAYGLVSTIHRRATQYTHTLQLSEQRTCEQRNLVAQREEEIARLRARPGAGQALRGFLANEGRVTCVILGVEGGLVVPRFVQWRGDRQVEMVAGTSPNDQVYVSEIFLAPDYSRIPTDPMGAWFLQLLTGGPARFNALAEAAHELADWEPYAEIIRYHHWEQERRLIEAEITELTGHCALVTAIPGPALGAVVERVGEGDVHKACIESAPASVS